jgi:signal transduction histidine kinase
VSAVLHAIDLASMREWDEAKALLEGLDDPVSNRLFMLVCELEAAEQLGLRQRSLVRHEVGNALTIAQANIEGIMDGLLPSTPARLEGVRASLASAASILEQLRRRPDAERQDDVIRIETFSICSLIAAHASAIAGLADAKGVRVVYDSCNQHLQTCEEFRGDASGVGQILRNVLINAVRYTPPGGTVEILCDREGSDIRLVVRDSGEGIAAEDLPHVFEEGFQGKNAVRESSGLGLGVVKKLAGLFGGSARVENGERGATFVITLPTTPLSA